MKTILFKLLKDFRYSKGKFILLVLAASLSSWGISSVVYGYLMTERDFEENFTATYPADMNIIIGEYKEEVLNAIQEDENVIDVERREVIYGRVKGSRDSWMPLVLYIVEDVKDMRIDQIQIQDTFNIKQGKLLIERNASFFLNEGQQEIEIVPGKGRESIKLKIDGFVHDARQAPAQMEGIVYAYATSIDMFEDYLSDSTRRLLIETDQSEDERELQSIYQRLEQVITQNESTVISYNIPPPGEHIHQGVVDGISFMQKTGGGVLSTMGIILLSLILLTWIFPQIRDIGVMKAIGASTAKISQAYVLVLLVILLAGLAIGMPLGYLTGYFYNKAVAFFQNFDVVEEVLPIQYHLLVFVISLIIPLLFAIAPLFKASKNSVSSAMNQTFYLAGVKLFKWSQKFNFNSKFKYGVNNLFRHTPRTALLALLLAIGLGLYFTSVNIDYSIRRDLAAHSKTSEYELLLGFPQMISAEEMDFLQSFESIQDYVPIKTERVSYNLSSSGHEEQGRIRYLSEKLKIESKYLLRGEIKKDCKDCLYVTGEKMAESFQGVEIGEEVQLTVGKGAVESYELTGVLSDLVLLGAPFLAYNDQKVQQFNALAIELEDHLLLEEVSEISNSIDERFLKEGIGLSSRNSIKRRIAGLLAHLAPTFLIIKVMGAFTIVIGLFGLTILLNLTIEERTREIGIIKSIGASFNNISGLFNLEFLWVTLVAIFIGFIFSYPLASGLISVVAESLLRRSVDQYFDFWSILISSVVVIGIQLLLIALYNRYKIKKNPRELLEFNF